MVVKKRLLWLVGTDPVPSRVDLYA